MHGQRWLTERGLHTAKHVMQNERTLIPIALPRRAQQSSSNNDSSSDAVNGGAGSRNKDKEALQSEPNFFKQYRQHASDVSHSHQSSSAAKQSEEFKQRLKESLKASQASSSQQQEKINDQEQEKHDGPGDTATFGTLLAGIGKSVRHRAKTVSHITHRVVSPVSRRVSPYMPASIASAASIVREAFFEEMQLLMMPPAQAAEFRHAKRKAKKKQQQERDPESASAADITHSPDQPPSSSHAADEHSETSSSGTAATSDESRTNAAGSGAVMVVAQPEEPFWKRQAKRFSELPGVRRLSRIVTGAAIRGRSAADDVYERLENSDSRVAHSVLDSYDYLRTAAVEENTHAASLRQIKERDPEFSVDVSLGFFQREMPKVLEAYLAGDQSKLEQTIASKEMLERLGGEARHWLSQGYKMDSQVLTVSDVELIEAKRVDNEPCLVVKFIAQQINCMRDLAGNVVEGAPDDIRAVHYVCAMEHTMTPRDDREGPAWQLRELAIQGMEQLTS